MDGLPPRVPPEPDPNVTRFSGLEVFDQHGLVTKEVAYRPIARGPLTHSPGHDRHVGMLVAHR